MKRLVMLLTLIGILCWSAFAVTTPASTAAQATLPPGWKQVTWEGIIISYPPELYKQQYIFKTLQPRNSARASAVIEHVCPQPGMDCGDNLYFDLFPRNGLSARDWVLRNQKGEYHDFRDVTIGGIKGVTYEVGNPREYPGATRYYVVPPNESDMLVIAGHVPDERIITLLEFIKTEQCFAETGNCIKDRFATYWQQNGGLAVFGFPITAATNEVNRDTGKTFLTQWLERNRFELHPENAAPYDMLLGRLGDDRLKQQGRNWQSFPKANSSAPHYFAATGHAIAHEPFWRYWSTHGLEFDGRNGSSEAESLALFGLPLSEPQMEVNSSGDRVLTQWFERARFEDHGRKGVLLGLLGNEVRGR